MTTPDYRPLDDGWRYTDVRTDEEHRYHLRIDKQAEGRYDAYAVCLPPYVNEPGMLVPTLEEGLITLAQLRSQPFPPLFPSDVFVPFGIIVMTSMDTISRDMAIRVAMMEGEGPMPAERRVAALAQAIALLRGAPLPKGSMDNWRGLTTLQ